MSRWARELADVDARWVLAAWAAVVVGAFALHAALTLMVLGWRSHARHEAARTRAAERQLPPSPRLQVSPEADLAELRAADEAWLDGYGWVDRPHGVAHIPVRRAIELLSRSRR